MSEKSIFNRLKNIISKCALACHMQKNTICNPRKASICNSSKASICHPREGGDPSRVVTKWIPAFAEMTNRTLMTNRVFAKIVNTTFTGITNGKSKTNNLIKFFRVNVKILCKILTLDHDNIASKAINYGIKSLLVFFIIFLFWAIFIPIKSAAIGEGIIVLDFNKKIIQHLEGGIVEKILVSEGQEVNAGDPVIFIHDIKAKSEQQIILRKLWTMMLQKQRLISEKNDDQEINIKEFLSKIGEVDGEDQKLLDETISTQTQLFNAKEAKSKGEINVLTKKFDEAKNQLIAFESQRKAANGKLAIAKKELKLIKPLVAENNLSILRQDDLEKEVFELEGRSGELLAETSKAKQQIAEAELTIANYRSDDLAKILDEVKQADMEIINLVSELSKAKDILKRTVIMAPVSGKIMNIKYHTIGAVIQPASEIMDIVPQSEELIIEAKIRPQDIDSVSEGLKAKVSLTAYKGKKVPKLDGEVINVSADIMVNEQSKESYFLARVKIDQKELANI
jgi:HlyD family secretion protein